MTKTLTGLAAASFLALSGNALAGEPLVLGAGDLDGITAAGMVDFDTNVVKFVDIDKTVDLVVNKTVDSTVTITGYLATAEASADAIDFSNNLAETDSFAQVSSLGAFSFSEALAAGDNGGGGGGGGG
ncbi:MAG: hypothetical protein AAFX81_13420 [Pseudomonadota bacterium]